MSDAANGGMNGRERFLRAARREPVDRPPVWLMRQAGRYLPEYLELRAKQSFMEAVRSPEIAAELTCQPIRRFGMDAAVIFSDILVPLEGFGLEVDFPKGVGPQVKPTVRDRAGVERIEAFDPEEKTGFLAESIRRTRAELGDEKAIVGFCGAPYTMASYLIEGGSSRNYENAKGLLYRDPALFTELAERLVDALIPYLGMQAEAGADVLQIFDSWGGGLSEAVYREVLFAPMERLVCATKAIGKPVILYVNGCSHLLDLLVELEPDVIGIDWRVDPKQAREKTAGRCALQGNLDPIVLWGGPEVVRERTRRMLDELGPEGLIVNVGSGLIPKTPVESVAAFVDTVKASGAASPDS